MVPPYFQTTVLHGPQMIFCIVCCQSFHNFCLEEEERPEEVVEEGAEGPVGKELYADTTVATGAEDEGEEGHNNHSSSSAVTQHRGSTSSGTLSWCCRRCQFCHVCGQQNGLLKVRIAYNLSWFWGSKDVYRWQ